MNDIEQRAIRAWNLETIDNTDDSNFIGQISGYAIVFGKPSVDLGFIEYIRPEALKGVDLNNVLALYNHDYGNVLGRTNSDTLKLSVDKKGLHFVLNIPDTTIGHDVYTNIKAGNLQGMSFGFTVAKGGESAKRENGEVIRTVHQIQQLHEISVVSVPAYEDTAVQVTRSGEQKEGKMNNQNKVEQPRTSDIKELQNKASELKANSAEFKNVQGDTLMNTPNPIEEKRTALNNYLHSRGEIRDGLKSAEKGVFVPEEVIYSQEYETHTKTDLASMVAKMPVTSTNGRYPILKHPDTTLHAVSELEKKPDLVTPEFNHVDWEVKTYHGNVPLASESIKDSDIDLTSLVVRYIDDIKTNTINKAIAKVLAGFKKKTVKETTLVDDFKKIINTEFNVVYDLSIVVTKSMFNELDKAKDDQGRYLLQEQIGTATGKTLLGLNLVIVEDDGFGGTAGSRQAFVGDLKRAVLYADRISTDITWVDNYIYGKILQAVIRFDVKQADENAGQFIELSETPQSN